MFGKKGQAATEYLIILAVVVIIALIVIGVLGGFPGMTKGISERDSASYWAGADIGIVRYKINATTISAMVLRNNKPFSVFVSTININNGSASTTALNVTLAPGASYSFTNISTICGGTAGNSYSYNVLLNYTDSQYSTIYNFTGEKPLVGTCQ